MVKTLPSTAGGVGLILGQAARIPHASWSKKQNMEVKHYCNRFNKDLKMIHIKNLKKKKTVRSTNLRVVVLLIAFSKHPSSLCSGYNSDILLLTSSQGQF